MGQILFKGTHVRETNQLSPMDISPEAFTKLLQTCSFLLIPPLAFLIESYWRDDDTEICTRLQDIYYMWSTGTQPSDGDIRRIWREYHYARFPTHRSWLVLLEGNRGLSMFRKVLADVRKKKTREPSWEVYQHALSKGLPLASLPVSHRKFLDKSQCREAVARNGWDFQYVPESLKNVNLAKLAVTQTPEAYIHCQPFCDDTDFNFFAVQQRGKNLQYVPSRLRSFELCRTAVTQDGLAIRY